MHRFESLLSSHDSARRLGHVLASFLLVGCGCSAARNSVEGDSRSTSVVEPGLMPSESDSTSTCGRETNLHGSGYDGAARSCLWDAWQNGSPAGLVITMHTVEGDPITYTLRVRPGPVVDVTVDSRDRFGSPGVTRTTCKTLEKRAADGDRFGFVLRGCEGRASEIVIP